MQLKCPMLWDLFSLFPAHAGVIPVRDEYGCDPDTFPRTRGGDPYDSQVNVKAVNFSPHTRG